MQRGNEQSQGENRRENEVSERLCQRRHPYLVGLGRVAVLREPAVGALKEWETKERRLTEGKMVLRADDCGHWMDPLLR